VVAVHALEDRAIAGMKTLEIEGLFRRVKVGHGHRGC
jgi:hypothetical protein